MRLLCLVPPKIVIFGRFKFPTSKKVTNHPLDPLYSFLIWKFLLLAIRQRWKLEIFGFEVYTPLVKTAHTYVRLLIIRTSLKPLLSVIDREKFFFIVAQQYFRNPPFQWHSESTPKPHLIRFSSEVFNWSDSEYDLKKMSVAIKWMLGATGLKAYFIIYERN